MGVHHRHLYETTTAAALKAELAEWLAVSHSLDATVDHLRHRYGVGYVALHDREANFWIALADLLHQFGLEHEPSFRIARELIDNGTATDLAREAGLTREEISARTRSYRRLRQKWETPAKRARKIPPLTPEPFVMQAGDVFAYATRDGNPNHPRPATGAARARTFRADAQNAFICLNTARVFFDTQARYFIVPVALFDPAKRVSIEDVSQAQLICHCEIDNRRFLPLGGWMSWERDVLEAVAPRKIGTVDPNYAALERVFGQSVHAPLSRDDGPEYPLWMNYGVLSNIARGHVWGETGETLERYLKAWSAA